MTGNKTAASSEVSETYRHIHIAIAQTANAISQRYARGPSGSQPVSDGGSR